MEGRGLSSLHQSGSAAGEGAREGEPQAQAVPKLMAQGSSAQTPRRATPMALSWHTSCCC